MKINIRKCDNCGTVNPKRLHNEDRLCGDCAVHGGFYTKVGWGGVGANGKVGWYKLQFPFSFHWRGWLRLRGKE